MTNLSDILPPSNLVTDSSTDTLTNKTLTAPKIADGGFIADANGNELIKLQTTSSAVNELEVTNAATGNAVIVGASGGDSNIDITFTPKGTGEVNIAADNFNYAGTAVTSTGAELNILDGVTSTTAELNYSDTGAAVGTVVASKVVTADANKDVSSFRNITLTGELDAGSLDVSGNVDIDGTTNLDAVDIDGVVQVDGATTFGVDDTGVDVKLFGATSGAYLLWDESEDKLSTAGGATVDIVKDKLLIGSTAVTTTAAELNVLDGITAVVGELNALDIGSTAVGTAVASKAVILDANKDYTGVRNLTITGELDAATLDVSGNVDIDGTLEADGITSEGAAVKVAGKETIWIPAVAMYPNTTNGCAAIAQVELANGPELKCLDFATGADDFAQFTVAFPKSWNEGTVTFQAFWTVTGTNTGTVAWGLAGGSIANDASINTAFGTAVVATALAHSGTSNDMMVSAESGAVTIANAAVNTVTFFEVHRDVSADDQSGDARLLGIKLFFTTDAGNDA